MGYYNNYTDPPPNSIEESFSVIELEDYESLESNSSVEEQTEDVKDMANRINDTTIVDLSSDGYTPPKYANNNNDKQIQNTYSVKPFIFSCCSGYSLGIVSMLILLYFV